MRVVYSKTLSQKKKKTMNIKKRAKRKLKAIKGFSFTSVPLFLEFVFMLAS